VVMEGGQGSSSGLLSDEDFSGIVKDLVALFKAGGIRDITLNEDTTVPGFAVGYVVHVFCKARIFLATTPPPMTFKICMSDEYIRQNIESTKFKLTSEQSSEMKRKSLQEMPVSRRNLGLLVNFVKEYCEKLCKMGEPPSDPLPPIRRPRRLPPPQLPPLPQSVNPAEDSNGSLPPIRKTGRPGDAGTEPSPPLDYSASRNQELTNLLKRIENVIDTIQTDCIDEATLSLIKGWFNALKRQLNGF
jgi:hypothetical protein